MRPEDVPQKWVAAAAKAFWRHLIRDDPPVTDGGANPDVIPTRLPGELRAALAAVIPLIEARERDACAKVAEEHHEAHKSKAAALCCAAPINGVALFNYQSRYDEASKIAAAIRARGTP